MSSSGLKQKDLTGCVICGKGVAHDQNILFYRVRIERYGLDVRAVQRAVGLELVMGGSPLAQVMGPDEDLAIRIASYDGLVCQPCALDLSPCSVALLTEKMAELEEQKRLSKK